MGNSLCNCYRQIITQDMLNEAIKNEREIANKRVSQEIDIGARNMEIALAKEREAFRTTLHLQKLATERIISKAIENERHHFSDLLKDKFRLMRWVRSTSIQSSLVNRKSSDLQSEDDIINKAFWSEGHNTISELDSS